MKFPRYILLIVATLFLSPTFAAEPPFRFVLHNLHLNKFDVGGFEAPAVTHSVYKDSKGRIWIGTESGLYRYDGNEVRSFLHDPADPASIPNSFVKAIVEAGDGTIWIGTWGGGIAYFDEATRRFHTPHQQPAEPGPSFDLKVWSMAMDENDRIWIGTFSSGLFRYDPRTEELRQVFHSRPEESLAMNRIDSVFVDANNRVWFAPIRDGMHVIDAETLEPALALADSLKNGSFTDIATFADGRMVIAEYSAVHVLDDSGAVLRTMDVTSNASNDRIMEILPYDDSSVLIGSGGGTLWYVDVSTGESFRLPAGTHPGAMEPSIVWDMDLAADGDILIGGTTGLWMVPAVSRQFWTVSGFEDNRFFFFTETRAIARHDDALYLNSGTTIYKIDFTTLPKRPRILEGDIFVSVAGHRPLWMEHGWDGRFWIGTDNQVFYVDDGRKAATPAQGLRGAHTLLADKERRKVFTVTPWGLQTLDGDVLQLDEEKLRMSFDGIHGARKAPQHMYAGPGNDIWTGSFSGLERFDVNTGKNLPVFSDGATRNDWNDPYTTFIHALSGNEFLIGSSNGIWRASLNSNGEITVLENAFPAEPFASSSFSSILTASNGRLMFVGAPGLLEYDPATGTIRSINVDEGLPAYDVYAAGFHQWDDGLVVLSGTTGPLLFYPDDINFSAAPRELLITDIASFRGNETLPWPVDADGLRFRYEDRVVRFKFGLLDYLNPMNNRYAIRLDGFQDAWLDLGGLNEFSFTNLDPGSYRLDIKVTEGLTGKGASKSIPFEVLPPWWHTWWAYAMYALVIFGSVFWYWLSLQRKIEREREISRRLREADRIKSHFLNELEEKVEDATQDLRHAIEALEIKNVELDAAQHRAVDASRLKSEFLANMSHEIRTPMNGVLGFTQLLGKSKLDNDQREYVETIDKSAKSLLNIINDVLDVSKIEAGKLMIDSVGFDPRQVLCDTLEALTPVAYEKNLELLGHYAGDLPDGLRGDSARIRQVVTNLVGNAIKFTDAGHVLVHADRYADSGGKQWLRIRVTDTGRGITAEDREKLFQAFESGSARFASQYTGTGLGLVITKKLCEAMGGQVELDSIPGKGTTVTLDLPLVEDRNPENRYGAGKPLRERHVLLIDPYPESRESLRARFAHWGARVTALAELIVPVENDIDIVVIGIARGRLDDTNRLRMLGERLPGNLPRICLAAATDRDLLRALEQACGMTCAPKIGHLQGQLRRMLELLGVAAAAPAHAETPAVNRLGGLHVVVADDNRINRYFLKKILELHGARVTEADNGASVLETLLPSGGRHGIDIALLDIHMPDIDGLEVARRIRAHGETRLPLLAVSANVQPDTYEAALAAGINDYLLKPVEEMKLVEAVLEWTGREVPVATDG